MVVVVTWVLKKKSLNQINPGCKVLHDLNKHATNGDKIEEIMLVAKHKVWKIQHQAHTK